MEEIDLLDWPACYLPFPLGSSFYRNSTLKRIQISAEPAGRG